MSNVSSPAMRSATKNKLGKDPAYLAFIRSLPCAVCALWGWPQRTFTEAAHVGDRGLGQKCPDRETIPLCARHHRLEWDSIHRLGKKFWSFNGLDRDTLVAELKAAYERRAA